ncbi:MAG: DNA polymerase III subunit delta', partial [Pseudomonadota bacterium]|nr:DNA polymerase III subunit delta' [Pseudomonadota bacterium]
MTIPAWLTRQWEQCVHAQQTGRMPHALLLAGPPGLGKLAFAKRLGELLLCQQGKQPGTNAACGQCSACIWQANGSHPDFVLVTPEEGKK